MRPPVVLTIAGSDSSGGAGVAADVRTASVLGAWAAVAVTAVTAQDAGGVHDLAILTPSLVRAQIQAAGAVDAVKTGMLGNGAVVAAVAQAISDFGLPAPVVDPVVMSTSGRRLLDEDGVQILRDALLPLAALVTPNVDEAALLARLDVVDRKGMVAAARALVAAGSKAALVTGGHLPGRIVEDCLVVGDEEAIWISGPRVEGRHTHGTGCVLSTAIAAHLAQRASIQDACAHGAELVRASIADGFAGSVNPLSWRA